MGKCQSEDPFVCFGAGPEEHKGRKVPEQNREGGRTEKWTEQSSRQERAVDRSRGGS